MDAMRSKVIGSGSCDSIRLLFIDPSREHRRQLRLLVDPFCFELRTAYSFDYALYRCRDWKPDVILCQFHTSVSKLEHVSRMTSGQHGGEILKEFKRRFPSAYLFLIAEDLPGDYKALLHGRFVPGTRWGAILDIMGHRCRNNRVRAAE